MKNVFAAELTRTRHSAPARLPFFGLVVGVVQILGFFGVAEGSPDYRVLFAWQGMYVTTLAVPLAALLAALTQRREKLAREGGGWWRPVPRSYIRLARAVVVTAQASLVTCFVMLLGPVMTAVIMGVDIPYEKLILAMVLVCVGLVPTVIAALVLSLKAGVYATVGIACVMQIAGTLLAESPVWWAMPWTYAVRAALTPLGIHANLVPSNDIVINPWWPTLGSIVATVVWIVVYVVLPERWDIGHGRTHRTRGRASYIALSTPTPATTVVTRTRPHPIWAAITAARHTPIMWLCLAACVSFPLVLWTWNVHYVRGWAGIILLPIGTATLVGLLWAAHSKGLRGIATHIPLQRWARGVFGICLLVVLSMSVLGALTLGSRAHGLSFALVALTAGLTLCAFNLWVIAHWGLGLLIAVTALGTVVGALVGQHYFDATPAWLLGPWSWAYSAHEPVRVLIAVGLSGISLALWLPLWLRAVRRYVARG